MEFNGLQGELIADSLWLRVYTTDRDAAYAFFVAWRRSLGEKPISSNALMIWSESTYTDIYLVY